MLTTLTSTRAVSIYFGDVEQSIFSFLISIVHKAKGRQLDYHRRVTLRLDAATFLVERGCSCRKGVVSGASKDFERLQSVADDEHEETIRPILMNKLPEEYERRLRAILFARARRKI